MDANEIIEQLRAEDTEAFNKIYLLYRNKLLLMAGNMVGEKAHDIVAEAFIKFYHNRAHIKAVDLKGVQWYLWNTTQNLCFRMLENEKKEQQKARDYVYISTETTYEPVTIPGLNAERLNAIMEALHQLQPRQIGEIFRMAFIEGLDNSEIARKLNISEPTVISQKSRGVKKMKALFKNSPLWGILFFIWLLF